MVNNLYILYQVDSKCMFLKYYEEYYEMDYFGINYIIRVLSCQYKINGQKKDFCLKKN